MKILLLTNLFPPDFEGGYELAAERLANGLRDRGHEVVAVTSGLRRSYKGGPDDREWVRRILERRFLPAPNWRDPWRRLQAWRNLVFIESVAWRNVPRIREFLTGQQFDLAYVFGLQGIGLSCVSPIQEAGIPVVWHFGDHSVADQLVRFDLSRLFRLTGDTILRSVKRQEQTIRLEHCAFLSRYLEQHFWEKGARPVNTYIVPRGIEFELGEDVDRERLLPATFLMASRLVPDKGYGVALEACALLAARRPELSWRLAIAGRGDERYESQLRVWVRDSEALRSRVEFLGQIPRKEVLSRMRSATAFISASVWGEPFGSTNVEAMASGTPLIISETGGALEIATNGCSALTYPKDSPEALSAAMEAVLVDNALALCIARGGLDRVKEAYLFDVILDQTEAIMKSFLGDGDAGQIEAPASATS